MELNKKKELLDNAAKVLKSEFIGIDSVIDQIIHYTRPWYLYSEMMTRPAIVCLWGLTGVGKTDVVKRLSELLNMSSKYLHIDVGEYDNLSLISDIERMTDNKSEDGIFNCIISIDEFQLGRSIDNGVETNKPGLRTIWDLIDSGVITRTRYYNSYLINRILRELKKMKDYGVKVNKGKVEDAKFLKDLNKIYQCSYGGPIDDECLDILNKDIVIDFFSPDTYRDVDEILSDASKINSMEDMISYVSDLFNNVSVNRKYDFSRSIIFVIGNLDEVYYMNDDFNPDINPDIFYDTTKSITITEVKDCLSTRFRSEQISRLGNNHIIYPSINSESYRKIIDDKVDKFVHKVKDKLNINLTVHQGLKDLIYDEGVYPSQGVRPVLSTIYDILECKFYDIISKFNSVYMMDMNYENGNIVSLCDGQTVIIPYEARLTKMRESKDDDAQAVTAVHESGHAIVQCILSGKVPSQIRSVTSNGGLNGFTELGRINDKRKNDICNAYTEVAQICMYMAGYVAEFIIFGGNMVGKGSYDDIVRYTDLIIRDITKYGLLLSSANTVYKGSPGCKFKVNPMSYDGTYRSLADNRGFIKAGVNSSVGSLENINELVNLMTSRLLSFTKDILSSNRELLLNMSERLMNNPIMKEEEIREMMSNYGLSGDYSINLDINGWSNDCLIFSFDKDNIVERNKNYREVLTEEIKRFREAENLESE